MHNSHRPAQDIGISTEPGLGVVKIQTYNARDPGPRLAQAFKTPTPQPHREARNGGLGLAMVGPAEWIVTGPRTDVGSWLEMVTSAFAEELVLAVDLSAGRTGLIFEGRAAERLIGLCPMDLSPSTFLINCVARTRISDVAIMVIRLDNVRLRVIVDQSYTAQLLGVIQHGHASPRSQGAR